MLFQKFQKMRQEKHFTKNWSDVMFNYADIRNIAPFSIAKEEKRQLLSKNLKELTEFHQEKCEKYRKILGALKSYV